MSLQEKYLKNFTDDKTFVDIYTDQFEDSTFGFIVKFSDEFLLLEQFTSIGEVNGISVFKREDISRIRWKGNDISTTEIFALKEKRIENLEEIQVGSITEVLKSVSDKFGYVTIHVQNLDSGISLIGEIVEMDEDIIVVNEFGTYSSLDRKMLMINIDEITKVEAGADYENNLKEIFRK